MENKKLFIGLIVLCGILAISTVAAVTTRLVLLFPRYFRVEEHYTHIVQDHEQRKLGIEVHSTLKQYRWIDGQRYLIYTYSHPGVTTEIGENLTLAKLTGDSLWNLTDYLNNVTYIALGIDVGLTNASTVLPGEWNRSSSLTPEYIGAGNCNYSYSFYPSGSGITNATSLNFKSGIGVTYSMWAYDTFADISYTANDQIDVEWSVDVQYS